MSEAFMFTHALLLAASLAGSARVTGTSSPVAERLTTINPVPSDFFSGYTTIAAGHLYFYAGTSDGNGLYVWDEERQRPTFLGEVPNGGVMELRGRAYFIGFRGGVSSLWTTDGTFAGTQPIVAVEGAFNPAVVAGGLLYFMGQTSVWRSDGTATGTFPLNVKGAFTVDSAEFAQLGDDVLFLSLDQDANRIGLWKSHGTIGTTVRVADLGAISEPGENYARFAYGLTRVGQKVVFFTLEGDDYRMWSSNGTEAGTAAIRDFIGDGGGIGGGYGIPLGPSKPVGDDAALFFADDGVHGRELWRTNGTATGTRLVKDIAPGPASSDSAYSFGRTVSISPSMNGFQLLSADDGVHGAELWRSDGTEAGTRLVADITPGPDPSDPFFFTRAGAYVIFDAEDGRLWRSDGTEEGTQRFGDLMGVPAPLGDGASVAARTGLWRTDGESLEPLASGGIPVGLPPVTLAGAGARVLFTGGSVGLWASDGTPAGTARIGDFASVSDLDSAAGRAWFVPFGGSARGEPWVSDGTDAGTHALTAGPPPYGARSFTEAGRRAFFIAYGSTSGDELWVTGGSVESTRMVQGFASIGSLTAMDDAVYFTAYGGFPWKSDGTPAGTAQIADLAVLSISACSGRLFFFAYAPDEPNFDLWVSDGTPAGTQFLHANVGAPAHPTPSGTRLFFDRASSTHGQELWVSDGTKAGTRLLQTFVTIDSIVAGPNDSIFVAATDAEHGAELWHSDGTEDGTILLDDILPGLEGSTPASLLVADGILLFAARDAEHGIELWRSDGTPEGTFLLQDIFPGPASSEPSSLAVAGPRVFFRAADPEAGPQLWELPITAISNAPRPGERPREPRVVPPRD